MNIPAFIRKHDTFLLSLIAVVLINAVGVTLFWRADLTKNKVYTLSPASKRAVSSLSEPLTVKVFFTSNLPAPYNTIERYVRDLLAEYAVAGNRYFNYEFYDVSPNGGAASQRNRKLAQSYGIAPVQVQMIEQDQVKFQNALMGMVLIHGDITETIPSITTTDGLEYRITSAIGKMVNKVSALVSLKDKVAVKLYLSSSLRAVGPSINISGLAGLPGKIGSLVDKLNDRYYGKLSFTAIDPSGRPELEKEASDSHVMFLRWKSFRDARGKTIAANTAYAGLVVSHGNRSETVPLINAQTLPIFGTRYSLADMDDVEQALSKTIESVINVNEELGYLSGHGVPSLSPSSGIGNFDTRLSEDYSLTPVDLDKGIPDSLSCLMIAGPQEPFSDYELYQIDQFLMKGKSLAIFLDPFREISQGGGNPFQNSGPLFLPLHTGLGKLLSRYGLTAGKSFVLDTSCYHQRGPSIFGGGEQPLYFAPIIRSDKIADVPYLRNLKGFIMLKASPVSVDKRTMKENSLAYTRLFSSSDRSWLLSGRIDLNPIYLRPPVDASKFKSEPLAYVVEGSFPSYFSDKPVPPEPAPKEKAPKASKKKRADRVTSRGAVIKKGKPGKIFLIGTSAILKDNLFDRQGDTPNAQLVLNIIDALNNRTDNAIMRTKVQRFNPLRETGPGARTFIKTANIVGPPVAVIAAGLIVWFRRAARKRAIRKMFA
jgi:gliding motility-associatede transport system auxiliary component